MQQISPLEIIIGVIVAVATSLLIWWVKKLLVLPGRMDSLDSKVGRLESKVEDVVSEQKKQWSVLMTIRDALLSLGIMKPLSKSLSPKQITETGHKLLSNHSMEEWLKNCPLVQNFEQFRDMEELDIFLKCLNWVETEGKRKVAEIMYESNIIFKEQCHELLALAIRDEILSKIKQAHTAD